MIKVSDLLNKLNKFEKMAQIVDESELSNQTVSRKGLDSLIESLKNCLNRVQSKSMAFYSSIKKNPLLKNEDVLRYTMSDLAKAITSVQELINEVYSSGQLSSLKAANAEKLLVSTVNEIKFGDFYGLDQESSNLLSQLKTDMYECANKLKEVSRYSSVRGVWEKHHSSKADEMMTGTVGLSDEADKFLYRLRNLESSKEPPATKKQKVKELEKTLQKIPLNGEVYNLYLDKLQKIKAKIEKELNSLGPSIKQTPSAL